MRSFTLLRSLTLAAALTLSVGALAESTPEGFVKSKQSELVTLIKQKSGGNAKRIEAVFDDMLDYDALARGALKDHWDSRTEAERKEFQEILKQLVQRAYRKNLDKTINYDVTFDGVDQGKDGKIVRTVAKSKTNVREDPVAIDYVVHRVDGDWRVQDIVTEGSSLVTNYRRQFGKIIKKDGFDELLRRMKKKLAE